MTAELWAIPALLLGLLVIGLIALVRGRARPSTPPDTRTGPATRPLRRAPAAAPATATSRPHESFGPSDRADGDTEPDNLHLRRQAASETLRLARLRAAADAARLDALRQARADALAQGVPPTVTALRRAPVPLRRPITEPKPASGDAGSPGGLGARQPEGQPQAQAQPQTQTQPQPQPPAQTLMPSLQPVPQAPQRPIPPAPAPAVVAPAAVPTTLPATAPWPPAALPVASPTPPATAITVLVVDDSKVVRVKTSRLLEKHHYRVLLADDGLTALDTLAREWPDLVITDVEMPGLDGFGLTQQLRSRPGGQRMPVIMITSSNERHRDAAHQAGVSVLLGKPYPEEQLLAEVEKALGRVAQPAPAGLVMQ